MKGVFGNIVNTLGTIVGLIIAIPIAFKLLFINLWALLIGGILLIIGYMLLVDFMKTRQS